MTNADFEDLTPTGAPTSAGVPAPSLNREIVRLAVPALGALLAEPLYVLADTAVVGHLGIDPLAGLAIASAILLTTYSIFIFLAYGTTSTVARYVGAGDEREAAHHAVQGLWMALGIGVVLAAALAACSGPLVDLLGATGAVRTEALTYLRISLIGIPAMLLVFAGTGYLRGLQDTRTPLFVAIGSATANFVLELVLIHGFDFGIGASALTTVIAQWGAAAVYVMWVTRAVRTHRVPLGPDARRLARLAVLGRDLFIRTIALRAAFVVTTAVAARIGSPELAGHQIAFELFAFCAMGLDALGIAAQAMIGRLLGAGDAEGARAAGDRLMSWGVICGSLVGVVLLIVRVPLAAVFTGDVLVEQLAAFLVVLLAVSMPVNGLVFALDGILIGAGDVRFLGWTTPFIAYVYAMTAWLVLVYDGGIGWLWGALILFMVMRGVALVWRYLTDGWIHLGTPGSPDETDIADPLVVPQEDLAF